MPPTYAGFWPRLGALLLDSLIVVAAVAALAIPGVILMVSGYDDFDESFDGIAVVGLVLFLLAMALGTVVWFWIGWREGKTGQGPGKKAVGIKVWRTDGAGPIGGAKGIGRRAFAYFVSGQVMYLGYLWMLWDKPRHQTWHDKVVDSVVVRV